jgi:hypothetical protein
MEEIKWIVTPPCRLCAAPPEFKRRYACLGCEKLHKNEKQPAVKVKHRLSKAELRQRNARIAALRKDGASYERIAVMLKMPRATVQSAAKAARFVDEQIDITYSN